MKIAAVTSGGMLAGHFGSADAITVFNIENDRVKGTEVITRSEGCGCRSGIAGELVERGVTVVLAQHMGPGIYTILRRNHIKVVRGCSGEVFSLIDSYLEGNLSDAPVACEGHEHGHHCNHH